MNEEHGIPYWRSDWLTCMGHLPGHAAGTLSHTYCSLVVSRRSDLAKTVAAPAPQRKPSLPPEARALSKLSRPITDLQGPNDLDTTAATTPSTALRIALKKRPAVEPVAPPTEARARKTGAQLR